MANYEKHKQNREYSSYFDNDLAAKYGSAKN